jgi:type II secretion system protein H
MGARGTPRTSATGSDLTVRTRTPMSKVHAGKRGFSLMELMVVMVLIGVMTAMIVPEMKGTFQDELLRSTARKLVRVMHFAYSQSISLQQQHLVRVDAKAGRCFVEPRNRSRQPTVENTDSTNGVKTATGSADLLGSAAQFDSKITVEIRKSRQPSADEPAGEAPEESNFNSIPDAITFYPDGTAERAEIVLRDNEGFGLALRINPSTARTELVELQRLPPR